MAALQLSLRTKQTTKENQQGNKRFHMFIRIPDFFIQTAKSVNTHIMKLKPSANTVTLAPQK